MAFARTPDADAVVWRPDAATCESANLTHFLRALGVASFEALNARASAEPAWFHDALIRFLDYRFMRPYQQVLDLEDGLPFARWCVGGLTNVVFNALDCRRGSPGYDREALVWEGEDGTVSRWTLRDLDAQTCRLAWGLRRLGIGRGDVVGMYLPNLPQAAAAMLAIAKIGARFLWMSDMGWLVGPMLVFGGLLVGATVVLAEGAPNHPEPDRLWRLVERHRVSYLGLAPTVARLSMGLPAGTLEALDLSSLRVMVSTGEPWTPEAWHWSFQQVGRGRVPLLNFSGGTEMGGILTGTVIHPLKPCAFAGPVPGTGADVVDAEGRSVPAGVTGELVMRAPTIGLTRGLWHARERYLQSYWSRLPGLWVHGDFASRDADGMWYVHGRSDDTLKIAGKRTGPAEIEALLMAEGLLADAAAIGIPDPIKGTALVCVCVPREGIDPTAATSRLSAAVVSGLGAPFKPAAVAFVPDLPRTRNMKVMRRVVRAAWLAQDPGDLSTLINPESLQAVQASALANLR